MSKKVKKYAYVIYEWPLSGYVIPAHAQALKITIKKHIDILLQDFNDDTDLLKILPNVGLQVVQDINDYLKANKKDLLPDSTKATLQVNLFNKPIKKFEFSRQKKVYIFAIWKESVLQKLAVWELCEILMHYLKANKKDLLPDTGKSLSEALIFASTNPQYDKRLFMGL